jgi:hypothetical protein
MHLLRASASREEATSTRAAIGLAAPILASSMKTSAAVCGVIALIFGIITSRASRTYLVYSYLAKKLTSSLALFSLA